MEKKLSSKILIQKMGLISMVKKIKKGRLKIGDTLKVGKVKFILEKNDKTATVVETASDMSGMEKVEPLEVSEQPVVSDSQKASASDMSGMEKVEPLEVSEQPVVSDSQKASASDMSGMEKIEPLEVSEQPVVSDSQKASVGAPSPRQEVLQDVAVAGGECSTTFFDDGQFSPVRDQTVTLTLNMDKRDYIDFSDEDEDSAEDIIEDRREGDSLEVTTLVSGNIFVERLLPFEKWIFLYGESAT